MNLFLIAARVAFPADARLAAFSVAVNRSMMVQAVRKTLEGILGGKLKMTDSEIDAKMSAILKFVGPEDQEDIIQSVLRGVAQAPNLNFENTSHAWGYFKAALENREKDWRNRSKKERKKEVPIDELNRGHGTWGDPQGDRAIELSEDPETEKKVEMKFFIEELGEELPYLKETLTPDENALFDVIFEDEIGDFVKSGPGGKGGTNINQSTALKEKYPEIYKRNAKRWYNFVSELRTKLLKKIQDFVEREVPDKSFDRMLDMLKWADES